MIPRPERLKNPPPRGGTGFPSLTEEASPIYIARERLPDRERLESRVLPRPLPLWLARPPIAEIFRCKAGLIAAKPRA